MDNAPDTMTTQIETEKMRYGLLMAYDVEDGKVVDLDLFVLAKVKKELTQREKVEELIRVIDMDELLARRSPPPPFTKVPSDVNEKFKEYNVMYPVEESRTVGPNPNQFMGANGFG